MKPRVFDAIPTAEAARRLGVSIYRVRLWADLELDTIRYHGRLYFDAAAVDRLAARRAAMGCGEAAS